MTMLLQCITSTFMMASNFFIVSMLSPFDPEFYSLAEYMLAALAQLCMICHFAGIVTHTVSLVITQIAGIYLFIGTSIFFKIPTMVVEI
nr:unnamed protein product [Callosobruchus analis]